MKIVTSYDYRPASPRKIKIGDRFGRWTVVEKTAGWSMWLTRCDCGTERESQSGHLFGGNTLSCGCYRDELCSQRAKKHGGWGTAEYRVWCGIKGRCHSADNKDFPRYGGRGIAVCDRWRYSFEAFIKDMGARPFSKATIERVDNDGNYSPDNCRWATRKEQTENRHTSRIIVMDGERITVAEAARRLSIDRSTIRGRAINHGETRQDAVNYYLSKRVVA